MKVFIDLFCGLGGASEAFLGTDWKVIRIDNNNELLDHVRGMWLLDMMDPLNVRSVIYNHLYDLNVERVVVWASPPCTEFSMKNPNRPQDGEFDMALLANTVWLIDWIEEEIDAMVSLMNNDQIPEPNLSCKNCAYSEQYAKLVCNPVKDDSEEIQGNLF